MADTDEPGRWRTLAETAASLGISERTVRRRIDAGRYRTRQEDGRVLVWLPASGGHRAGTPTAQAPPPVGQTPSAADDGQMAAASADAIAALERLVSQAMARAESAERRAAELSATSAMWQERAGNLEAQVESLLALPAHEPAYVPWWRRLLRRR